MIFLRPQLFPLSLTGAEFTWYSSLPPNSVQSSPTMKRLFHNRFYNPQLEAFVVDLLGIKQQANEPVTEIFGKI